VLDEQRNAYQPFLYAIFAADLKAPIGTRSRYFWYQLRRPRWAARALADQGFNFRMLAASRAMPSGIRSVEIAE
jgi:hypothetical protein